MWCSERCVRCGVWGEWSERVVIGFKVINIGAEVEHVNTVFVVFRGEDLAEIVG